MPTLKGIFSVVFLPTFIDSEVGNCSGANLTINVPSKAEDGYYMIAEVAYAAPLQSNIITPPNGWTLVTEEYDSNVGWLSLYYRFASSEPASYTWVMDTTDGCSGGISVYKCVDTITPVNSKSNKNTGNSSTPTALSMSTLKKGSKLLFFVAGVGFTTITPPSDWAGRWNTTKAGSADRQKGNIGSTGNVVATLDAPTYWIALMVALSPCIDIGKTVTLQLDWDDNSDNEDGFRIEQSPNGTDSWVTVATVAADITTYQYVVNTGATYYFRVFAYNDVGDSDPSNTASISV